MRLLVAVWMLGCFGVFVNFAVATEFGRDCERASLSLNDTWETHVEDGGKQMWKPDVAETHAWKQTKVPGSLLPGLDRAQKVKTKFVWARKTFKLDDAQTAKGVVLRWDGVRFGATAWLNGTQIAEHAAVGPARILIPAGIAKSGENVLMLKVPGWAGVAKSKSGYPLMPTGASTQGWGSKQAQIYYDVWLEFYDRAYMKWVLAMPDVEKGTVTFRVWVDSAGRLPGTVDVAVEVRPWKEKPVVGKGSAKITKGRSPVDIPVNIRNAKTWTLDERNLYEATLRTEADGKSCDEMTFRFGLRELAVVDGHYRLNGKPFRFRGSNLVNEWLWGDVGNVFNADIKGYIVDEARAMNLNSFRTHTSPPPHLWLNVADEHGTFILAEFPVLYNYGNFKFTREEKEVFHRNAILDATGWVTSLWNHPSVAMWVLSNESPGDHSWEAGPFRDHVVGLDPTRVTMRTGVGSGTKSTVDVHTCGNWTRNTETHWLQVFERHIARKDPKRVLTNSEYMNNFGDPAVKWLGRSKHPDTGLAKAEFCLEHTEAMRRLGYDGMLAYMYAGWTRIRGRNNWRQDYPTPMAAALHSSMAPVLASLEIVDRNYLPNQKMTTRVALLSDELVDVPGTIDVYVTPKHPLFVPDADALKAAVWKTSFKRTFKATSTDSMDLEWSLPEKEGVYYLAAVLSRKGDKPVVSQRIVRAIRPTRDALKGRKVLVLGGEQVTIDWLKRQGATVFDALEGADVVLIWDIDKVPEDARKQAGALKKYVEAGGRIVILEQHHWTWPELVDFKIGRALSSRAFAYPNVKHPMLKDIDPDYLKRWNGMPNAVATRVIEGPALKQGKKLLWAEAPSKTIALSMPTGKGEVLVTTLQIKHRITRRNQGYDPVAERMLANLLR